MPLILCSKPYGIHPDSKPPMKLRNGSTAQGYYDENDDYYEKITDSNGHVKWYRLEDE